MSTLASVVIYDIYANLPAAGIPGRMFYVSAGTNAGKGYRDNGTSWDQVITPGGGGGSAAGTANFSATGGVISGGVFTGCVTGVTRSATGQFTVALTSPPSNYLALFSGSNNATPIAFLLYPSSSYTGSGFGLNCYNSSGSSFEDPDICFILIP